MAPWFFSPTKPVSFLLSYSAFSVLSIETRALTCPIHCSSQQPCHLDLEQSSTKEHLNPSLRQMMCLSRYQMRFLSLSFCTCSRLRMTCFASSGLANSLTTELCAGNWAC